MAPYQDDYENTGSTVTWIIIDIKNKKIITIVIVIIQKLELQNKTGGMKILCEHVLDKTKQGKLCDNFPSTFC